MAYSPTQTKSKQRWRKKHNIDSREQGRTITITREQRRLVLSLLEDFRHKDEFRPLNPNELIYAEDLIKKLEGDL